MTRLSDIFDIEYGSRAVPPASKCEGGETPLVSASGTNNGIVGYVDVPPTHSFVLSIPRVGSVAEASFQKDPCAVGENCLVAIPKTELSDHEMLFYAYCIRMSRDRFSYGYILTPARLGGLLVPEIPAWVNETEIPTLDIPPVKKEPLDTSSWQWFNYPDLFDISLGNIQSVGDCEEGEVPVVTASSTNNGVSAWIDRDPDFEGGVITVAKDGEPGVAFFQSEPFCANSHVAIFKPRFEMTESIAQFLCVLIELEKSRYSFGRAWGLKRMKDSKIKLPVIPGSSSIDWEWIEEYMQQFDGMKDVLHTINEC